jgi:hypothetical protein
MVNAIQLELMPSHLGIHVFRHGSNAGGHNILDQNHNERPPA